MGRISPGPTRWPPGAEKRLVPAKSNLKPQTSNRLCVVPRRWWVWWQGLVVVEYVMVWCGDVRYVGWVVRGAWLCWGVVGM